MGLALRGLWHILTGMETFGDKLRQAVESRGLLLDEVAEATGLGIENIRALERNDFGALPGDKVIIEGLRSFAQLVEVDPDQVVADYLRERQGCLVPAALELDEGIESLVESDEWLLVEPSKPSPGRWARPAILASAILAVAVIAFLYWSRTSAVSASRQPAVAQDRPPIRQAAQVTPEPTGAMVGKTASPVDSPARTPAPIKQISASRQVSSSKQVPASRLSIPDHGVGRGVVHHELVGKTDSFAEGERVWFWTLVQGGTPGESIEHVWLHEEKEAFRVKMELGGARWRTRSYHDLGPGSKGRWAVEARNQAGRVLARQEFSCSARP